MEHLAARRPAWALLYLYGHGGRRRTGDRRPLRPRWRPERPAQHDRGPGPHRPCRVGAGRAPGDPPGPAVSVGGERARLFAGCGQRRAPGLAGQISGLYPDRHHPARRRHPPHLPELPQAAGRGLCAADAHLRLWQRGRGKAAAAAVQLGLRPHQLQFPGGQLLHRPRPGRSAGAGVQRDDRRPARGGHRRDHGCGV